MTGAPFDGVTTRGLVDGRELDGLSFGLVRVGLARGAGVLVRGAGDVYAVLDGIVGLGAVAPERAPVDAVDEHPAVTPRTHKAPATKPARRSGPQRITRPP
jgi:hypothetical protein